MIFSLLSTTKTLGSKTSARKNNPIELEDFSSSKVHQIPPIIDKIYQQILSDDSTLLPVIWQAIDSFGKKINGFENNTEPMENIVYRLKKDYETQKDPKIKASLAYLRALMHLEGYGCYKDLRLAKSLADEAKKYQPIAYALLGIIASKTGKKSETEKNKLCFNYFEKAIKAGYYRAHKSIAQLSLLQNDVRKAHHHIQQLKTDDNDIPVNLVRVKVALARNSQEALVKELASIFQSKYLHLYQEEVKACCQLVIENPIYQQPYLSEMCFSNPYWHNQSLKSIVEDNWLARTQEKPQDRPHKTACCV